MLLISEYCNHIFINNLDIKTELVLISPKLLKIAEQPQEFWEILYLGPFPHMRGVTINVEAS